MTSNIESTRRALLSAINENILEAERMLKLGADQMFVCTSDDSILVLGLDGQLYRFVLTTSPNAHWFTDEAKALNVARSWNGLAADSLKVFVRPLGEVLVDFVAKQRELVEHTSHFS